MLSKICQCFQFMDWPTNTLSAAAQLLPAKAASVPQETCCAAEMQQLMYKRLVQRGNIPTCLKCMQTLNDARCADSTSVLSQAR